MNSLASLPTERQCHIALLKLLHGSSACPECAGRLLFRRSYARCRVCRIKHSVRATTWFRGSNLSLQKLWLLIWCWQKQKSTGTTKLQVKLSDKIRAITPGQSTVIYDGQYVVGGGIVV